MIRPVALLLLLTPALLCQDQPRVHLANGIKVGEATSTSALVWARITRDAERNADGTAFPKAKPREPQWPAEIALDDMEGAVPGASGALRIRYWPDGSEAEVVETQWQSVGPVTDYTHTFALADLTPGLQYRLVVEARSPGTKKASASIRGGFRTAPLADDEAAATFCVVTGQDYARRDDKQLGHRIYRHMRALSPDFFVHTGDTIYYDKPQPFARTVPVARFKWNRLYGLPLPRTFHTEVASWFIKDDHDTLKNDCWPDQQYGELTWDTGLRLFREQNPIGPSSYRSVRWGKHLECWFLEGREFRSPNNTKDGPDKTILGAEQLAWLKRTLAESDATFRVIVSATPIVGPDRGSKNDNHANKGFTHEGDILRNLLAGTPNTVVVCGDRHWQYASKDPTTGLREWSCGPTSNAHAGGFNMRQRSEMHDFLRIGGGFLQVSVELDDGPRLALRHRNPEGEVTHEDILLPR